MCPYLKVSKIATSLTGTELRLTDMHTTMPRTNTIVHRAGEKTACVVACVRSGVTPSCGGQSGR